MDGRSGARRGDAQTGGDGSSGVDPQRNASPSAREHRLPLEALLASVARRGASLVDQQHQVLERLERHEQDSHHLAGLFGLDHLAARLRRNSNTLMVLAGLPTTRTITRPIPLREVVWAAMSEVNGYQRVRVGPVPAGMVSEAPASDLVHLLAELLENALGFSARSDKVWVQANRADSSAPCEVRITNRGPALEQGELRRLNDQLAGHVPYIGNGDQTGLFIVGTLARRHQIDVRLEPAPGRASGVVAAVALPVHLFEESVTDTAVDPTVRPVPEERGRHRAPPADITVRPPLLQPAQGQSAEPADQSPHVPEPRPVTQTQAHRRSWMLGRRGRR